MATNAKSDGKHPEPPVLCKDTYHVSRTRIYVIAKVTTLVFALTVFLHTYQPQSRHWSNDDLSHIPQHKTLLPHIHNSHIWPSTHSTVNLHNRTKHRYKSSELNHIFPKRFLEYNVTDQFRFLDVSSPLFNKNVRGYINVVDGNTNQASDVLVSFVALNAAYPSYPMAWGDSETDSALELGYAFSGYTKIAVRISLKPNTQKLLRLFEIRSEILDLYVDGDLSWTADNIITHTSHGNTEFEAGRLDAPMITHNVSSSSITGDIFGFYVADANLNLTNVHGAIGAFLIPRENSDVAINLESIQLKTDTGTIHFEMWADWEYWPMQPFTHTTFIESESGSIWTATPHGSLTNVTSSTGNVTALMIPFGAEHDDDESWIHIILDQGQLYIQVYDTLPDSLQDGKFNPLQRTRSRHKVYQGNMTIRYPDGWYGELEAMVSGGTLDFDANQLEKVERGAWWVKASRGQGESFMESWVEHGDLDIKVGLGE
jgi:hypothetical protein